MNDYLINLVLQNPNDADLGKKVRAYFNTMKNQAFSGNGSISATLEGQSPTDNRSLLKG